MADFRDRSKSFLKDVSRAAAWMMKANVGYNHWWRAGVLTDSNPDKSSRPIFDQPTAGKIFQELIARGLLVEAGGGSSPPAYFMKYDIDGWDKAVSDGRPIIGRLKKLNRDWFPLLLAFLLGCLVIAMQDSVVGLIKTLFHALNKLVALA